jgi:hypothetical protein
MNERIRELILQAGFPKFGEMYVVTDSEELKRFADLILEECRKVLTEEYQKTPIECCGHLLRLDEAILNHFYNSSIDT